MSYDNYERNAGCGCILVLLTIAFIIIGIAKFAWSSSEYIILSHTWEITQEIMDYMTVQHEIVGHTIPDAENVENILYTERSECVSSGKTMSCKQVPITRYSVTDWVLTDKVVVSGDHLEPIIYPDVIIKDCGSDVTIGCERLGYQYGIYRIWFDEKNKMCLVDENIWNNIVDNETRISITKHWFLDQYYSCNSLVVLDY